MSVKSTGIAGTIATLEQFYRTLPDKPSTEVVRQKAQSLPDPELAVHVMRFLPRRKGGAPQPFTADEITEAFLQVVLNEETGLTPKGVIHLRSLLRAAGKNLGVAFTELYDLVMATGCGVVPTLADLAALVKELLESKEAVVATDKLREQRKKRLEAKLTAGDIEPWICAVALEWIERYDTPAPTVEQIEALLLDAEVLGRLAKTEGMSWDALARQARSHHEHRQVGAALVGLGESTE